MRQYQKENDTYERSADPLDVRFVKPWSFIPQKEPLWLLSPIKSLLQTVFLYHTGGFGFHSITGRLLYKQDF